jgi:voltage-gated potassium channel
VIALTTVGLVILMGTLGFVVIEGWPPFDALYMTVITITTVGYGEVRPLSTIGRTFAIVLILLGVGTVFYSLTLLAQIVLEEQFAPARARRRRMRQQVKRMRDHVIVCGFGRVGRQVAAELKRAGVPVVIVDLNGEMVEHCAGAGYGCVIGDASEDCVLQEAGIAHARGLIATTNSDANNIYVTLAARALRPDLFIVARVDRDDAAAKLRKAGADRVISPYHLGGRRMASLVLRPAVVDFVETVLSSQSGPLQLEEVVLREGAALAGRSLADLRGAFAIDVSVLAVRKPDGGVLTNPDPATVVGVGDILIALGAPDRLRGLERLVGGRVAGGSGR